MGSPHVGQMLIPIVDAPAVEKAFLAGVGGEIHTTVGGTLDHKRFEPLLIRGKVRLLSDGVFRSESFGELWLSGNTAVVDVQNFTLVIASRAVNLYDRSFFYAHGQNPANFDAVIVKSPHCQKHMYAAWCDEMILVDAPGSSSANIPYLGHKRCPRPIFPLDKNINFHPKVEIFTRA
jgi:microcystin degradation protein MlrC